MCLTDNTSQRTDLGPQGTFAALPERDWGSTGCHVGSYEKRARPYYRSALDARLGLPSHTLKTHSAGKDQRRGQEA